MKRILAIILSVVVWCALGAYLVFAARKCTREQDSTMLRQVDITVVDEGKARVVTPETIKKLLKEKGYDLGNIATNKINTIEIKNYLESYSFIKRAKVYTDFTGLLTIEIIQRRPILRINTYNGYNVFVSDDGWIIPVQPGSTVYLPIVTGSFQMPFPVGYGGSLDSIEEKLLETDRKAKRELAAELNKIDMQRRALYKAEQPKIDLYRKQMRKINKKRDEEEKKILKSALVEKEEKRRAIFNGELQKIAASGRELYEKEKQRSVVQKKEEQKYLYLLKLINFVKLISNNTFWDAQIVQINVGAGGGTGGLVYWKEPEVELIPRIGRHIVVFGTLDDAEQKLDKLMEFYKKVLDHEGWDAYSTINLKYRGQIVCRK